MRTILNIYNY